MTTTLALARDTEEVLGMLGDYDDDVFGRMPVGGAGDVSEFDAMSPTEFGRMGVGGAGDASEFDALLPTEADNINFNIDPLTGTFTIDAETDEMIPGDESIEGEFESPEEHFPVFGAALREFQAAETPPRVARIDTEETFGTFVCEKAVSELERRVGELRAALEEHESAKTHGARGRSMRKWESIIGAAQAVADLKDAETPHDAVGAMPQVPLDLPPQAEGKVSCWKDGDSVVCSVRFQTKNGQPRIATMAAKPKADASAVARGALLAGVEPVTVLGALPVLADAACGRRLVPDVLGAAMRVRGREEVCNMKEPVFAVRPGNAGSAPLAALMYVQQAADAGSPQAMEEMARIEGIARTEQGAVLGSLLAQAGSRLYDPQKRIRALEQKSPTTVLGCLAPPRFEGRENLTFAQRYALMGMYL